MKDDNKNKQEKNNPQYGGNPLADMLNVLIFFVVMLIVMLILVHFRGQ